MPFEQGPIRPPSEAFSLLVRVTRNCNWNRCVFCPVYKGERYSRRSVDEVLHDLDAMVAKLGAGARTVFLQDANPMLVRPDEMARILEGVAERFEQVERITAYGRADVLSKRSVDELQALRDRGLTRLHVGLESGCDEVLTLVNKGVTRAQQLEAGRRVKQAGIELCEYVMPGLGGRALSEAHIRDTASALVEIQPDFVRLRTTTILPGCELAGMVAERRFEPISEVEAVQEVRSLIAWLAGFRGRLESDHMMNLLMEIRGTLPDDRDELLARCDAFLDMPDERQQRFVLGRRLGRLTSLAQMERPGVEQELALLLERMTSRGETSEALFARLRGMVI